MKHFWIGLGVLVVILVGGLAVCYTLCNGITDTAQELTTALEAAWEENEPLVQEALAQAQEIWDENLALASSFIDHEVLEAGGRMFARLAAAVQDGQWAEFKLQCQELLTLLQQLIRGELPTWENIL